MEILRIVHCRVMKGCGPDWTDKTFTVFLDDIEHDTPEHSINEMVIYDTKQQLKAAGFTHYTIGDIHNA